MRKWRIAYMYFVSPCKIHRYAEMQTNRQTDSWKHRENYNVIKH